MENNEPVIEPIEGHSMDVRVYTGTFAGRTGIHVDMTSETGRSARTPDDAYHKHCCYTSRYGWEIYYTVPEDEDGEDAPYWDVIEQGEGGEWLELQMDAISAIAKCITKY